MDEEWHYAELGKPVGPITFDALAEYLRKVRGPGDVGVWHPKLPDWRAAKDVPEIYDSVLRPASLSQTRIDSVTGVAASEKREPQTQSKLPYGKISLPIALGSAGAIVGVLGELIYNNSAAGFATLAGEFSGLALLTALFAWPLWRRSHHATGAAVCLIAVVLLVLTNAGKISDNFTAQNLKQALSGDPIQIQAAAKANSSNAILQLVAAATRMGSETSQRTERLSAEIEPPALAKELDYKQASLADLDDYRSALRLAEGNATAALPRYRALLADERRKLEAFAQTQNLDPGTVRAFLGGVDKRHARSDGLGSQILLARAQLYAAYGKALDIVIEQFGRYSVRANGQLVFSTQLIADQYTAAAHEISLAVKRVTELEEATKQAIQTQQEGWDKVVSGK